MSLRRREDVALGDLLAQECIYDAQNVPEWTLRLKNSVTSAAAQA
jgi:hypothetical protein